MKSEDDQHLSSENEEVDDEEEVSGQPSRRRCRCPDSLLNFCPYKVFVTSLYWLMFFGCGLLTAGIAVSLPDLHEFLNNTLSVDMSVVSLVFSVRGAGLLCSGYVLGKLADRLKHSWRWYHLNLHHLAACGVICLGLPLSLIPFIPIYFISISLHFIIGIGGNTILVVSALLPKSLFRNNRITASVIQGCHFTFGFGCFVFPLFLGSTIFRFDWPAWTNIIVIFYIAFAIQMIPIILCCLPAPFFDPQEVEEKRRRRKMKKLKKSQKKEDKEEKEEKIGIISRVKYWVKNRFNESFLKKDIDKIREIRKMGRNEEVEESKTFCDKVRIFIKYKRRQFHFIRFFFFLFTGISMVLYNAQNKSFQNLIFLYSHNRGFDKSTAAYTNTVYFSCYSLSRFTFIFLFLFVDAVTTIFVLETGTLITLVVMVILRKHDLVIWIGCSVVAICNSPVFSAHFVLPRSFGIEPTGMETSFIATAAGVGSLVPSGVSALMGVENDYFLVSVLVLAVFMIVFYYFAFCLGTIFRSRKLKKKKRLLVKKLIEEKKKNMVVEEKSIKNDLGEGEGEGELLDIELEEMSMNSSNENSV